MCVYFIYNAKIALNIYTAIMRVCKQTPTHLTSMLILSIFKSTLSSMVSELKDEDLKQQNFNFDLMK